MKIPPARPALLRPLVLLPLLLLSGCFIARDTSNEPLFSDRLAELRIGSTTATEAAAALGAPSEVVELHDRSAWRYEYTVTKQAAFTIIILTFVNGDRRSDRCWLFFDKNDILQHIGTTMEAADTRYAMPWQEVR